ncbi:hypothetical protein Mgra_00009498, partial [Meloidogyne graminicola]
MQEFDRNFNESMQSKNKDKLDVFLDKILEIYGNNNQTKRIKEISKMNIEDIIVIVGTYLFQCNIEINEINPTADLEPGIISMVEAARV